MNNLVVVDLAIGQRAATATWQGSWPLQFPRWRVKSDDCRFRSSAQQQDPPEMGGNSVKDGRFSTIRWAG